MRKFAQGFATLLTGLLAMSSLAVAGNGALLGVNTLYPLINYTEGGVVQGAVYNGTTLIITGTPVFVTFTPTGAAEFITGSGLTLTANINAAGTFSGGSFTISGTVDDTATMTTFASPLLTGTVTDYGIVDIGGPGGTDLADFKLTATGGTLLARMGGSGAKIGMTATLEGSGFAGTFGSNWSAARAKGNVGPNPNTIPFPCFNVSSLSVKDRSGTTNDEVHMSKGGVRLPTGVNFNPAVDVVTVTFDGLTITIPAGSFIQNGSAQDYSFNTASGVMPKIKMRLNFAQATWSFDLTKGDVALITTGNGVDVTLTVGTYTGTDHAPVTSGGNSSSSDHQGHAPSCKLSGNSSDSSSPGSGKMSSISSLTLQTPSGGHVTKSVTDRSISHPSTAYVDDTTGELAIADTSGGACLQCGGVVTGANGGTFTIKAIRARPNGKLAQKCGVYNASCNIMPPGQ